MQSRLYGLDHLRALAITLVFFYHYRIPIFGHPEWVTNASKFGWTGVDLFFVLSGFLISSQLFLQVKHEERISFKLFFLKRFFRIMPAFWTVLAIYFCIPAFHEKEGLAPLWKYLSFTQNFGLNIRTNGTFSHAWSLCIEEHFYLFLPLVLMGLVACKLFRKGFWLIFVLVLFGFLIRSFGWNHFIEPNLDNENGWLFWYKYIYYPTYNRLDSLLAGVAIAGIYQFYPVLWQKLSKFGNIFIVLGIGILTGAYFLCTGSENSYGASVFGFPLVALGYGFIVIGAVSPTSILYKWNSKVTTFIATLSYAIYLTHKGVIHITQIFFGSMGLDVNGNIMLLICIAACIVAALAINLLIEKPFLKLREKLVN